MIIDFHTHCFPDALAPRAMSRLAATASTIAISPTTDGTAAGLLGSMRNAGIDRSVVCNIATNAHQMPKVNDFAIETLMRFPSLIPLGSLHPHGEALEEELARLVSAGITGIKIHPDYVGIHIDDPDFEPVFALCEARGVFVITHAGLDPISPDHIYCTPERVRRVMDKFPRLKLIVAHMGGYHCEEEFLSLLCGQSVYIDTSLLSHRPERNGELRRILLEHDSSRILFATDTPWADAKREIDAIHAMDLPQALVDNILLNNAISLLRSVNYKGYGT